MGRIQGEEKSIFLAKHFGRFVVGRRGGFCWGLPKAGVLLLSESWAADL
jgi:hypothetical protein